MTPIAVAKAVETGLNFLGQGAINVGGGFLSDYIARRHEDWSRRENYKYNEMAADNAQVRQKELQAYLQQLQYQQYYDLESPRAIIQQLRDAGLSPSLYANSGLGGGVSGVSTAGAAQGAGVSGVNNMGLPLPQINVAEIGLKNAQAELAHEQAEKLRGNNAEGAATVENLHADTAKKLEEAGLAHASKCLTESQTILTDIKSELESKTLNFNVNKARSESEKAANLAMTSLYESISASAQAEVDEQTIQERIDIAKFQKELLQADIAIRKSDVKLNDARISEISAEIQKWQAEISLQAGSLAVELQNANTKREFNAIMDKWYDGQLKNLRDRLGFDKEKFGKENARLWTQLILTFINDAQGNLLNFIADVVPS